MKRTKLELAERDLLDYVAANGGSVAVKELDEHLRGLGFGKTCIEQAKKNNGRSKSNRHQGEWVFTAYVDADLHYIARTASV
jgi:hypothetical protein